MNIMTPTSTAQNAGDGKTRQKPPRLTRWFIIVGLLLALLVAAIVGFNAFRNHMIAQFFANNKPAPIVVSADEAKSEVIPNLLTAVGSLVAVQQVNVTSDLNGRVTDILFTAGTSVTAGTPLVQLFDAPERADLASFKAQSVAAKLALDRAQQLASRQFGPQATVDTSQAAYDQAMAAIQKTEAIISQKLVKAPFDGELGVRQVDVGQYLSAGTQIVSLTNLSKLFANFAVTEKQSATLRVGQDVRIVVDAYPGRTFEGKVTTIEPQLSTDTRSIRVQATLNNPDKILKPGMFATTTVVLESRPAVVTVLETAVDYTLYGDSVYRIIEKEVDGKKQLVADRTFVRTGERSNGRTEITSGLKAGEKVVALGQVKVQPGAAVTISTEPLPPIGNVPRH